jgi:hypothetical protein
MRTKKKFAGVVSAVGLALVAASAIGPSADAASTAPRAS